MRLVALVLSIGFLSACSQQQVVPSGSSDQLAQLNLTISWDTSETAPVQQASYQGSNPETLPADLLLAYKPGETPKRVQSGDDKSRYLTDGYKLEPDLPLTAFGTVAQGHLDLLQMQAVWVYSRGAGVVVAVIDSGVDSQHLALRSAILLGYDFVQEQPEVVDESGHGTAVAALIAGRGPQWGMAPEASILPLRVLDAHNQGSSYNVARAILYSVNLLEGFNNPYKADVINLSLGGYGYSAAIHEAIQRASLAGALVIGASGNEGRPDLAFPAVLPEVISVAAADIIKGQWQLTPYANHGEGLDLLAPLGGLTTSNRGTYAESGLLSASAGTVDGSERVHGTSFAAAEVSGLAALILALEPHPVQASRILLNSAIESNQAMPMQPGIRVMQPLAAIRAATPDPQTGEVLVQVLDAGTGQEQFRFAGEAAQTLALSPGRYQLQVFKDSDANGLLWLEPSLHTSEVLDLRMGDKLSLKLHLH